MIDGFLVYLPIFPCGAAPVGGVGPDVGMARSLEANDLPVVDQRQAGSDHFDEDCRFPLAGDLGPGLICGYRDLSEPRKRKADEGERAEGDGLGAVHGSVVGRRIMWLPPNVTAARPKAKAARPQGASLLPGSLRHMCLQIRPH